MAFSLTTHVVRIRISPETCLDHDMGHNEAAYQQKKPNTTCTKVKMGVQT